MGALVPALHLEDGQRVCNASPSSQVTKLHIFQSQLRVNYDVYVLEKELWPQHHGAGANRNGLYAADPGKTHSYL